MFELPKGVRLQFCWSIFARHCWVHENLTISEFTHNVMAAFTPLLVKTAYKHLIDVERLPGHGVGGSAAPRLTASVNRLSSILQQFSYSRHI